jgi:hypothetical protein
VLGIRAERGEGEVNKAYWEEIRSSMDIISFLVVTIGFFF